MDFILIIVKWLILFPVFVFLTGATFTIVVTGISMFIRGSDHDDYTWIGSMGKRGREKMVVLVSGIILTLILFGVIPF